MSADSRISAAAFDRFAVVLFGSPEVVERVQALRTTCAEFAPIALTADRCQTWSEGLFCGAWLDVELTDALVALHWRLVEELADHGETIYPGEASGEFRPHLTIVQEVASELIESVVETINVSEHRFAWTAHEVALVARRGGLDWETVATFPLGS